MRYGQPFSRQGDAAPLQKFSMPSSYRLAHTQATEHHQKAEYSLSVEHIRSGQSTLSPGAPRSAVAAAAAEAEAAPW